MAVQRRGTSCGGGAGSNSCAESEGMTRIHPEEHSISSETGNISPEVTKANVLFLVNYAEKLMLKWIREK